MKKSKKDYKPVVYAVLTGVLIIVVFGVLYTSMKIPRVGFAFGTLTTPTISAVINSIDTDSTGVIPVIGKNSGNDLNIIISSKFMPAFNIFDEASRLDDEINPTDANLVVFSTSTGDDHNAIMDSLLDEWECPQDRAIIKVDETGDGLKLLIEGKTLADLDAAVDLLVDYQSYDLGYDCIKILSDGSRIPCLMVYRDLPDTMNIGAPSIVTLIIDAEAFTDVIRIFAINDSFPDGTGSNKQLATNFIGRFTTAGTFEAAYAPIQDMRPVRDDVITYDFAPSSTDGTFFGHLIDTEPPFVYDQCPVFGDTHVDIAAECADHEDCRPACDGPKILPYACDNGACVLGTGLVCDTSCPGATCESDSDCTGDETCNMATCLCEAVETCSDGIMNQDESDVDCGGVCGATCLVGDTCDLNADCANNNCAGGVCTAPAACDDGIKNGLETDVDCGGGECNPCIIGQNCNINSDCIFNLCIGGLCKATLKSTFLNITGSPATYKTVIGGEAPTEDNLASLDMNGKFRITTTVIDDTIADPENENLIIIGGPCANKAAGVVMDRQWVGGVAASNCAEGFESGKGKLTVYENNGKKQIIVAGYTGMDTRVAARVVVDYDTTFVNNLGVIEVETNGTLTSPAIQ